MSQEEKRIKDELEKNPLDIRSRFNLIMLYYNNRDYQNAIDNCEFMLKNCVDRNIDNLKKYTKKEKNKLMDWLGSIESVYIKSLAKLEQYEKALNALKEEIELCKHIVDYFEGFYGGEEIQIYKLAILLNKKEEKEQMKKKLIEVYHMSSEQMKKIEEEALNKIFYF